jgi:DNA repair and recombination RAD54-like protein
MPSNSGKKGDQTPTKASGGGFGTPTFKPFRTPSFNTPTPTRSGGNQRKRKRISYKEDGQADDKENDGDANGSDSDDGGKKKKKNSSFSMGNKEFGADGVLGDMGRLCNREFPVFEVKAKEMVFSRG